MRSNKASRLETTVQGSKGSPKFKRKKASKKKSSKRHAQMARLELERDQAVAKLKELEDLLDKLPDIFESKFSQRLAPLLERQRLLLEENAHLRAQVEQLMSQLGDMSLEYQQAHSRKSLAFIGLKPASNRSLQPLAEQPMSESITPEAGLFPMRLNVA